MKDEAEELLSLQRKINSLKDEKKTLEGELKAQTKRLKDELGTEDVAAAEAKVAAMRKQTATLREQISMGLAALRKEME